MSTRLNARRYAVKYILVRQLGSRCKRCGYDDLTYINVFTFHHRDPKRKLFEINVAINSGRSYQELINEIKKCDLLCRNCHAVVHDELKHMKVNVYEEYLKYINTKHTKVLENKKGVPTCNELKRLIENHSQSEIAKIYGVKTGTVGYWVSKFGLRQYKPKKPKCRPSEEELKKLIKEKSAREVGVIYGVSDKAVKRWLDKYGIENPRGKIFYSPNKINWNDFVS